MKMNLEAGAVVFVEIEGNDVDFVSAGALQANFSRTHSICRIV
jgi:hypothetical protein